MRKIKRIIYKSHRKLDDNELVKLPILVALVLIANLSIMAWELIIFGVICWSLLGAYALTRVYYVDNRWGEENKWRELTKEEKVQKNRAKKLDKILKKSLYEKIMDN